MLHKELREVRELASPAAQPALPPHLAGLPECLYKYGPLFERPLESRTDQPSAA